jgi:hypothetical protein
MWGIAGENNSRWQAMALVLGRYSMPTWRVLCCATVHKAIRSPRGELVHSYTFAHGQANCFLFAYREYD